MWVNFVGGARWTPITWPDLSALYNLLKFAGGRELALSGRGSSALLQVCYQWASVALSPVVAGAIRTRKWPLSRVFVGFNRQYVRSAHYGEVVGFFLGQKISREYD